MGMGLFYASLICIAIGVIMCLKGNGSLFNAPTGGGSRISPEQQAHLNQDIQQMTGHKDDYADYYHKNNVFAANKFGLCILAVGFVLLIVSFFI